MYNVCRHGIDYCNGTEFGKHVGLGEIDLTNLRNRKKSEMTKGTGMKKAYIGNKQLEAQDLRRWAKERKPRRREERLCFAAAVTVTRNPAELVTK